MELHRYGGYADAYRWCLYDSCLPNLGLKLVIDPTGLPFIYIFIYDCCCGMD